MASRSQNAFCSGTAGWSWSYVCRNSSFPSPINLSNWKLPPTKRGNRARAIARTGTIAKFPSPFAIFVTARIDLRIHAAKAVAVNSASTPGRSPKLEGIDYKKAAIDYPSKLTPERLHHLRTKPFYNLANKLPKFRGHGMDIETHRHFCDFANMAVALELPAGARILDAACGSGWLSEYFARLGYDVTGIDISPDLIEIARARVEQVAYDADHETPLRCRFMVHDAEGSPLAEEFDAVVCYDSLHHFEDERAVVRNLSAMTRYGGALFILEGDRPEEGSETEEELLEVMRRFETLESPFSRQYLRELLDENGLAVVGDYVTVNGLFERDSLESGRLRVEPPEVNYILCKKVVRETGQRASSVPDSRAPSRPRAVMSFAEQ